MFLAVQLVREPRSGYHVSSLLVSYITSTGAVKPNSFCLDCAYYSSFYLFTLNGLGSSTLDAPHPGDSDDNSTIRAP